MRSRLLCFCATVVVIAAVASAWVVSGETQLSDASSLAPRPQAEGFAVPDVDWPGLDGEGVNRQDGAAPPSSHACLDGAELQAGPGENCPGWRSTGPCGGNGCDC